MDLLVIRGGKPLAGRVAVGGSKNATLPIMAAALMIDGPVTLEGVPGLADVATLGRVLGSLGVCVRQGAAGSEEAARAPLAPDPSPQEEGGWDQGRVLTLGVEDESKCVAAYDLVRRMRASVCVLGPLLAKRGRAVVSLPGGCNIGDRPIDLHLRGLAALGADLRLERGYVVGVAGRLRGAEVDMAGPRGGTVTGTANVLAAAVLAEGRTVIRNAAREPEVCDLARFLVAAGANVEGVGTETLEVTGVDSLRPVTHRVIPDRIEAATLMIAAAITNGEVTLEGVPVEHLASVLDALDRAGASVETTGGAGGVLVRAHQVPRPVDVAAGPYPGFPTDAQAQWTALMTRADGTSRVQDDVFPDRFLHIPELARLGAAIGRSGAAVEIRGGRPLRGANLMASDLRASAALVLAALAAEGESVVRRIYHLDRGYERLDAKLAALGADVTRQPDLVEVAVAPPVAA